MEVETALITMIITVGNIVSPLHFGTWLFPYREHLITIVP